MTTLFEEIQQKCTQELIDSKNYHEIASVVNVGRTKQVLRTGEVGNGTILETLGFTVGNALLDLIHNNPAFKYVVPLLEQGRLVLHSNMVQTTLQSLVGQTIAAGVVFTQEHLDSINIKSVEPDPVTWMQCQEAVEKGV